MVSMAQARLGPDSVDAQAGAADVRKCLSPKVSPMPLPRVFIVALLAATLLGCTADPVDDGERHASADAGSEDIIRARDAAEEGDSPGEDDGGSQLEDVDDSGPDRDGAEDTDDGGPALEDVNDGGPDLEDVAPDTRPERGTDIGTFFNTYYYLADESDYSGADDTTLYDHHCDPIAEVPSDFADAACIEGSARLEDGTVINYHSPCSCGPCSFCWSEMDPNTHPWGKGSRGNALEPLRSWAVDTNVLAHGTVVYVEEWDGVDIPQIGELGGFVHDGCFRADDVGGGINGNHFDFFAGTPAMWQALEAIYPTRTDFTVYGDSPRCEHM
jgi:3D (Asp-Asp-Asp) domain-containing protein